MKNRTFFLVLFFIAFMFTAVLLMQAAEILLLPNIAMLFPKGIVALKERNLLFYAQGLMLIVVLPVFFFTFLFTWIYREGNQKAKYKPNWDQNKIAEIIWWGVPTLIIIAIGTVTWIETIELDPFKKLPSKKKPLAVQVVALQWKWLFLYPEEKIASLNLLPIPEKRVVNFEITADAPMNSFWIPQLSGQIFAMPKMRTKLSLIADEKGDYRGSSANISGKGFSEMHFIAKVMSEDDFQKWVDQVRKSGAKLNKKEYEILAKPTEDNPVVFYSLEETDLFDEIIMKYKVLNVR